MKNIYITYTTRLSYDMYELIIEDAESGSSAVIVWCGLRRIKHRGVNSNNII